MKVAFSTSFAPDEKSKSLGSGLEEIAASGGRSKHLLEALILLNR